MTVDLDFGALDEPARPPALPHHGRHHRWAAIGVVVVLLAVAAGGYLWSQRGGPVSQVTIRGTMILTDARTLRANCVGQGAFSDLRSGATVVLTDESGSRIASTRLQPGEPDFDDQICSYPFTITGVPANRQRYAVEVAHRGKGHHVAGRDGPERLDLLPQPDLTVGKNIGTLCIMDGVRSEQAASTLYEFVTLAVRELSTGREPSRTAISVLGSLESLGPLRVTTLAAREGVTQPSMTQLVKRLVERGYVALTVDATDARARLVTITEAGRTVLAERRRGSQQRLVALLAELGPDQAAALAAAVDDALPTLRERAAQANEPAA